MTECEYCEDGEAFTWTDVDDGYYAPCDECEEGRDLAYNHDEGMVAAALARREKSYDMYLEGLGR